VTESLARRLVPAEGSTHHVDVTRQDGVCTVCVVSKQPIVVAGIRTLLAESVDPSHVYESVADPVDADVVIYDVFNLATNEDRTGSGELDKLVASHPGRVLALSRLLQPGLTARALAAGAVAPVSVSADAEELAALVDAAASGELSTNPELARRHESDLAHLLRTEVALTPRDKTVLVRIAAGYSNAEIAADLFITVNTVKTAIRNLYARIGVRNRASAVAWALEHGYGGGVDLPRRNR
jgi:two-component system, NarL family, response regulator LiaR